MLRRVLFAALLLMLAIAVPIVNVQWCICDEGPADCIHVPLGILIDAQPAPPPQRTLRMDVAPPRLSLSPFFADISHIPLLLG